MNFNSLKPFVPSGPDYNLSKKLFQELGFELIWDAGDAAGFQNGNSGFILQQFNNKEFADNFMISVSIDNADKFWDEINEKKLVGKYGIRLSTPTNQPYGREVNIIDIAGVCWHFVQS